MEVLQLYKGYENIVKFTVNVSGISEKVSDVRFVMELDGFGIVLSGKVDENVVSFDFGKVVDLIKGKCKGMMEVYLRNQRFVPFECEVEVKEPVVVERYDKVQEAKMVDIQVKRIDKSEVVEKKEEGKNEVEYNKYNIKYNIEQKKRAMKFLVK